MVFILLTGCTEDKFSNTNSNESQVENHQFGSNSSNKNSNETVASNSYSDFEKSNITTNSKENLGAENSKSEYFSKDESINSNSSKNTNESENNLVVEKDDTTSEYIDRKTDNTIPVTPEDKNWSPDI